MTLLRRRFFCRKFAELYQLRPNHLVRQLGHRSTELECELIQLLADIRLKPNELNVHERTPSEPEGPVRRRFLPLIRFIIAISRSAALRKGAFSPLRTVFGLLDRDLIDVRQRPGAGRSFDCLDGDVLHLLLGFRQLLLERANLRRLRCRRLLQALHL